MLDIVFFPSAEWSFLCMTTGSRWAHLCPTVHMY